MKTKTFITLIALGAIITGSQAYAESDSPIAQLDRDQLRELRQSGDRAGVREHIQALNIERPNLTEEQKETIKELKEAGDREAVRDQLNDWGIEKLGQDKKGLRAGHVFQDLTEDQKEQVQELRESGDKELVREKLEEFGVELPEKPERPNLTEEQKETIKELKEAGDREAVKEYFEEIGVTKPRVKMQKRKEIFSSLTEDEKEVLQEARDVARAGDKDLAREMIQEVFENNETISTEKPSSGMFGFFKRIFN